MLGDSRLRQGELDPDHVRDRARGLLTVGEQACPPFFKSIELLGATVLPQIRVPAHPSGAWRSYLW
jgi:hypothetical protein